MTENILDKLKSEESENSSKIDQIILLLDQYDREECQFEAQELEALIEILKQEKQLVENSTIEVNLMQQMIEKMKKPTFNYLEEELHERFIKGIVCYEPVDLIVKNCVELSIKEVTQYKHALDKYIIKISEMESLQSKIIEPLKYKFQRELLQSTISCNDIIYDKSDDRLSVQECTLLFEKQNKLFLQGNEHELFITLFNELTFNLFIAEHKFELMGYAYQLLQKNVGLVDILVEYALIVNE